MDFPLSTKLWFVYHKSISEVKIKVWKGGLHDKKYFWSEDMSMNSWFATARWDVLSPPGVPIKA